MKRKQNKNFNYRTMVNHTQLRLLGTALYEMDARVPYPDRTAVLLRNTRLGDMVLARVSETYWEKIPDEVCKTSGLPLGARSRRERARRMEIWADSWDRPYTVWMESWRGDPFRRAYVEVMQSLSPSDLGEYALKQEYMSLFNMTHAMRQVEEN